MKKRFKFTAIIVTIALLFASCATSKQMFLMDKNTQRYESVEVDPYGAFNSTNKNDSVKYKVSVGNVILSVLLVETIVVPVVLVGWFLFEPKTPK